MEFHPFGNETTVPPAAWHSEPQVRGTFSILSASLITMFLCIWTALHVNVPEYEGDLKAQKRYKLWKRLRLGLSPGSWRKVGWMIVATLAPELVAWNAFEQRREVKKTTRHMRNYLGNWTDTHSWFATMGGFAFDLGSMPDSVFRDQFQRRRITITPKGIRNIAKHWPDLLKQRSLSREQIRARGKTDELTKFIACWQALWFIVQSIFRLSSGLAITLLELNVCGHAVCALLIYGLWWSKLQGVDEPYILADDVAYEAAKLMSYENDELQTVSNANEYVDEFSGDYEKLGNHMDTMDLEEDVEGRTWASLNNRCLSPIDPDAVDLDLQGPATILVACGPVRTRGRQDAHLRLRIGNAFWRINDAPSSHHRVMLSIDERAFHRLGHKAAIGSFHGSMHPRCGDWSINLSNLSIDVDPGTAASYLAAVTVATAIYGGLHLTAFRAVFPSAVEQLMWRMSSLTIVVFGPWLALLMLQLAEDDRTGHLYGEEAKNMIYFSLLILSVLFYLFCRIYLVVESFISVAHLSPSQLALPVWSSYVPHIS